MTQASQLKEIINLIVRYLIHNYNQKDNEIKLFLLLNEAMTVKIITLHFCSILQITYNITSIHSTFWRKECSGEACFRWQLKITNTTRKCNDQKPTHDLIVEKKLEKFILLWVSISNLPQIDLTQCNNHGFSTLNGLMVKPFSKQKMREK